MRLKPRLALATCIVLSLSACGGRKVVPTKATEIALPPELAKAFEVKEIAPALAATQPEKPAEEPKSKKKKGEKRKGEKKKKVAKGKPAEAQPAPVTEGVAGIAGPGNMNFKIPNRRPEKDPIWVGEKVWMDVTWLNTKAGEFELEVLPFKVMNGRKVYDIKGIARTSELFSLVYRAEDWVETFVDYEGWFPYKFVLHGDETKHVRDHLELFDHGAKKQYVAIHDNRIQKNEIHEEKGFKDLIPLSQDALSALYYVRTLKFEEGKELRFPMTTSGSQWETIVTVLGREEVNTKMGYLKAFKTKIETRFKGSLQQQGDAFMWFSDDERKILLRFEAKVRIGWVAGITKRIEPGMPEGMSNPAATEPPAVKDASGPTGAPGGAAGISSEPMPPQKGRHRGWFKTLLESVNGKK